MSSRVVLACLVALLCLAATPLWAVSPDKVIYSFPLDVDPGWTTEGAWEFGAPQGVGGDPDAAASGSNVYGYNLSGAYINDMPAYSLTTTALNCSGFTGVTLRFWRWLGVESSTFDNASIEVSNDGSSWTEIWANGSSSMQDAAWTQVEYDISAVADGEPTVYIRWVMGPTDPSVFYCGWNIDDIQLLGVPSTGILAWIPYADTGQEYPNMLSALSGYYPYFNVTETTTTDAGELAAELAGKHVFLVPEQELSTASDLETAGAAFGDALHNFVQGGGTVIVAGGWEGLSTGLFLTATGLLNDQWAADYYSGETLPVVDGTHPLAAGIGATVSAANSTAAYQLGPEATVVVSDGSGNAIVAARQMGAGAVVVMGYDYYEWDANAAIILANAVQYPRASKAVLLYESSPKLHVGAEALSRLSVPFSTAIDGNFNTTLASQDWHLVVGDAPFSAPSETDGWQPMIDWVGAGGHALLSTWNLQGQADLASAFGVSSPENLDVVPTVYDWDTEIPLFSFRESVPTSLTGWTNVYWGSDANSLTVTAPDALGIAGFSATPTAGQAAVVAGNGYGTLIDGFLWDDGNQDADSDGIKDVTELVMNQIQMLLTVPFPNFSASATECVTGDVVDFTDESDANVTGRLWDFGDGATATTRNPIHAYADPGRYAVSLVASNNNGSDMRFRDEYIKVGFPDTPPGDFWAFDQVLDCIDAGVVAGYDDGLYHPEFPIDRAQMAVYTARTLAGGDSGVPAGPGTATFPDVATDFWAFKYIEFAVNQGVVQGYDDLNYHPEIQLDRGQMAVFVARAVAGDEASVPAGPATATFTDVPTDFWAFKHVEFCAAQGIVTGYTVDTYEPTILVTRDQMAVYIARALPLIIF